MTHLLYLGLAIGLIAATVVVVASYSTLGFFPCAFLLLLIYLATRTIRRHVERTHE